MIVKFFANKKGGSSKAIDYLLNERESEGTARVLQGDPQLTKDLIKSIQHKQKVAVGCLSFEEQNISEDMKYQLMQDFEKHLLPGMKDRYNILWVEHTDKDRLELNFVIPKIDLPTQKSLNPYYHKADLSRVKRWQDLQNLKYNFSNPKDPAKRRTLQADTKQIRLNKDYEQLDKLLHNLTEQGQIHSREHLIELLQSENIEVTRQGKDYLSIKLPDSKKAKKFKGSIYNEQFTSITELEAICERAEREVREYNNKDIQAEQRRLNRELESYTQSKERELRKKYINVISKDRRTNKKTTESNLQSSQRQTINDRRNDNRKDRTEQQYENMANSDIINHINSNNNSSDNIFHDKYSIHRTTSSDILFLQDRPQTRGLNNDSTRTTTNGRIATRESDQFRAYANARRTRTELHRTIRERAKNIRKISISNSTKLSEHIEETTRRAFTSNEQLIRTNQRNIRRRSELRRERRELLGAITTAKETSMGYQRQLDEIKREYERFKRNILQLNEITLNYALNYQQQIFLNHYNHLSTNTEFKNFYIDKNKDYVKLVSKKDKINIKDYGDRITSLNTTNTDLQVKLMLDIAQSKSWDLRQIRVTGNDEFKAKVQAEIEERLMLEQSQNQYQSRSFQMNR